MIRLVAGTYETIDQDKQTGKIVIDKEGMRRHFLDTSRASELLVWTDTKVTVDEQLTDEQLLHITNLVGQSEMPIQCGTTTTEITLD